jgi:pyridoxine 4-dehydrogenase
LDRPATPGAARAVLRRAIVLGVDHIDTSQYYGPDVVDELIREALHPYPENLKLVTKVGARRDGTGRMIPAQRPDELRAGVEANLRSLRVERLDLVNLRLVDTGHDPVVPLEEQLLALEDMRLQGKLDLIGTRTSIARRALELVDVAAIQNGYSIIDRQDDEMVEFARERGIAYVPFFPLGWPFRGGPARLARHATIVQVADKHGATPAQIALAWLLARYERMLLIPGTNSIAHLDENMAASGLARSMTPTSPSSIASDHGRGITRPGSARMKRVMNGGGVEVDDRHAKSPLCATTVRHNPRLSRYEIAVYDGVLGGVALYQRHGRRIAFLHTQIEPRHEGAGLAGRLARAALDDVRELGLEVVPLCPFIAAYIRSHADDYLDLVVRAMREPLIEDGRPI